MLLKSIVLVGLSATLGLVAGFWVGRDVLPSDPAASRDSIPSPLSATPTGTNHRAGVTNAIRTAARTPDAEAKPKLNAKVTAATAESLALSQIDLTAEQGNFAEALGLAGKLPSSKARMAAYQSVFRKWAAKEPAKALSAALQMPEGYARESSLQSAASQWVMDDPAVAFAYLQTLPSGTAQRSVLQSMIGSWVKTDPKAAAAFIEAMPSGRIKSDALGLVAWQWAQSDIDSAAEWARTLPAGTGQREAMRRVASQMADSDPQEAAQFAAMLPAGSVRTEIMSSVAARWADKDLSSAVQWMQQLPDGRERQAALAQLGYKWMQADAPNALNYLQQYPDAFRADLLNRIAGRWGGQDPQTAVAWANTLPQDETRTRVLSTISANWAASDPQQAARFVSQLAPGDIQQSAALAVVSQWSSYDPAAAAQWAGGFEEGKLRASALQQVARQWGVYDPVASGEWLQTLPPGGSREEAVGSYASSLAYSYPQTAVQWAATLTDPIARNRQMESIARTWLKLDQPAAQTWIQQSSLPDPRKRVLLDSHPQQPASDPLASSMKNHPPKPTEFPRRNFLGSMAFAGASFTFLPGHVLALNGATPPSEKLNIAGIGVGGQGGSDLNSITKTSDVNIVALCDVDWARAGGSFKKFPDAKKYKDFRKMLEEEKGIDAVIVATPDHVHAPASLMALKLGKHVYCEKPLTHTVAEARKVAELAREKKVATQMGNQGQASEETRRLCEHVWSGAIGNVLEAHVWTDRPSQGLFKEYWPQGVDRPTDEPPVPPDLDWDLWLGPAPHRPYHPAYVPFKWRGWWDFGTGALGDIGCHALDPVFRAIKVGSQVVYPETRVAQDAAAALPPIHPVSVQGCSTRVNKETYPLGAIVTYEFPARASLSAVKVVWYDGGLRPPRPVGLPEGHQMGDNGRLLVGDKGFILGSRLYPEARRNEVGEVPKTIGRVADHYKEWVDACKGGKPGGTNFDWAGPLAEIVLLGNVALRVQLRQALTTAKLLWQPKELKFTDLDEANPFLNKQYRQGWL